MGKEDYDRIIVETNEKMEKVIRWYQDNKEWIDKEEFRAPMESGCIVLKEEGLEVAFESKGDVVELAVYPQGVRIPAFTYDYDPNTYKHSNYRYPAHISAQKRKIMQMALIYDRTDRKESIKYHSLMKLSAYYKDVVAVDESQNKTRTKHEAKRLRKSPSQPLPLVRKTYVVTDFEKSSLRLSGKKRSYTKPDREVAVKGFFRTSKNGKKSWVKPFLRYKDKGERRPKEYKI